MKKYTIEVVIEEQSDEFFEEITLNDNTGCNEVLIDVKETLQEKGYKFNIKLTKFENPS